MSVFRSFLDQFQQLRNQSTTSTKLAIGITAAVCIALIVGVGIWSSQPQYVPLAQDLAPAQAAEIVSKLNADGIKNDLNYNGSVVLVDKSKWNLAQIAVGDIAGPNQIAPGDFSVPPFADPNLIEFYQQQHLEKRLAASIARLKTVHLAVVHLNVVKSQVFLRDKGKSSASVVVESQPGKTISSQDAKSIVQLVSSSVKDLSTEDVKVIDTEGNLIAGNETQFGSSVTEYYSYQRKLETDLELKAESLLANMLGEGKALVRVTADLDFNQETSTEITHPVAEAIQRETSETNTQTLDKPGSGFTGTPSNIGPSRFVNSSAPVVQSNTKTDKDFVVGSVEFRKQKTQGEIIRLSIAAMVDLNPDTADESADPAAAAGKSGKATAKATTPQMTKDEVEAIIKAAVGFDEERYDEIEVVITSLAGGQQIELLDAPVQENWGFYNQIIRNASLGVAALFAFAFAVMTLRKMRPITVVEKSSTNISPERARHLSEMATLAKQHPEAMARIIAAWINEPATKTVAGPHKTAASSSRRAA